MAISSVKNIKYTNKNLYQRSYTENVATNQVSQPTSKLPPSIPFLGMPSLISIFTSKKPITTVAEQQVIRTEQEAINALRNKESGLFILVNELFSYLPFSEYQNLKPNSTPVLIYKHPKNSGNNLLPQRPGVTPRLLITAIDKGFERLVAIVEDGIHELSLPTDKNLRTAAAQKFAQRGQISPEIMALVKTTNQPNNDFLFGQAQIMIKAAQIDDLNLEQKAFS